MAHIGRELAVARVLSGKTARQVSAETRIHTTIISRIENGRENPTARQLDALKRATGWTEHLSFLVRMVLGDNTRLPSRAEPSQPHQDEQQLASTA